MKTLLQDCLDEVAGEYSWQDFCEFILNTQRDKEACIIQAAELALEKQKQFYEWVSAGEYVWNGETYAFVYMTEYGGMARTNESFTTEELYKKWKGELKS